MNILEFRPLERGVLKGFATVQLPSGMIVNDVTICESNGSRWANPPGRPKLDRNRALVRGPGGKIDYTPTITFTSNEARDRFSGGVVPALVDAGHLEAER